jgi:FkbM family methyltransferase
MTEIRKMHRRLRRKLGQYFGEAIFDSGFIQTLLSFEKKDGRVVDTVGVLKMEYEFPSALGCSLFYNGSFEEREIAFFETLLEPLPTPIILDIGANIGVHSLSWAAAKPNATIFAFEPSPSVYPLLQKNVQSNALLQTIKVFQTALSNESGKATFYQCEDSAYSSLKNTKRKAVVENFTVNMTTVDDFVQSQGIDHIDLIKIDVEGFEYEVIQGARNTLQSIAPRLFVEIYGGTDSNMDPEGTIKYLCDLGYKAFHLKDGRLLPYRKHEDADYNYFFSME